MQNTQQVSGVFPLVGTAPKKPNFDQELFNKSISKNALQQRYNLVKYILRKFPISAQDLEAIRRSCFVVSVGANTFLISYVLGRLLTKRWAEDFRIQEKCPFYNRIRNRLLFF
jgi:hypothetical protein